jgi:hypothetical protein
MLQSPEISRQGRRAPQSTTKTSLTLFHVVKAPIELGLLSFAQGEGFGVPSEGFPQMIERLELLVEAREPPTAAR